MRSILERTARVGVVAVGAMALMVGTAVANVQSIDIDNTAVGSSQQVQVTGTVTCTADQVGFFLQVNARVTQGTGSSQTLAQGTGNRTVCTGAAQSFSVRATVKSGAGFTDGAAQVKVGGRTGTQSNTMQDDGLTQTETVLLDIQP